MQLSFTRAGNGSRVSPIQKLRATKPIANSARAIISLVGAIMLLGLATAVAAQDIPEPITPLEVQPDENGVNLTSGLKTPDALVIGVPAAPRLKFDRMQNAGLYASGTMSPSYVEPFDRTAGWTVQTPGGSSESFQCGWDEDIAGLNLTSGKATRDVPIVSIPAAPRLQFDRIQNAAPFVKGEEIER